MQKLCGINKQMSEAQTESISRSVLQIKLVNVNNDDVYDKKGHLIICNKCHSCQASKSHAFLISFPIYRIK